MIHSTVPPGQVNRATVHATVSESRGRPVRPGGNLAPGRERGRGDRSDAGCLHRHRRRYCLPVPLQRGRSAAVSVHHDAALAGQRGGDPDRRSVGADSASRPGVFRDRILRQISVAGSEPAIARRSLEGSQAPSHAVKESPHRAPGTKHVQRNMLPVLRQDHELSFALRATSSPDTPDQAPFIAQPPPGGLIAAGRQLEASRTSYTAREGTPCADPPRRVKEHNRVRALESLDECDVVVAVDDPLLPREQFALLLSPLVVRRRNPPRFPEVDVEMDDGQPSLRRQRPRERARPPAPAMPVTTTRRPTKNAGAIHVAERSLSISRCSQARPGRVGHCSRAGETELSRVGLTRNAPNRTAFKPPRASGPSSGLTDAL